MTADQPPTADVNTVINAHKRSGYRLPVGEMLMWMLPKARVVEPGNPERPGNSSDDTAAAARLWPTSADLVGLPADAGG